MERVGEVRQWPRPRWLWMAATGAFGRERESEGEEGMGTGESERGAGRRMASFGRSRRRGEKQEVARMRAGGERVPLSSWREEGDDWHWPVSWAGTEPGQQVAQVSPGKGFPFFVYFSIFLTFV